MAHHAWLDSLSEDWVSQPGSDASLPHFTAPSSPPVSLDSKLENIRDRASRIPRLNGAGAKRPQHQHHHSSPSVLFERNPNEINIKTTQLGQSKLSHETKSSYLRRHFSRSASASTADSVIHNSVSRDKSRSASSAGNRENAPEWKRRLLYGELEYGESKDLFSSAATGLENIFRPPQAPGTRTTSRVENEGHTINETTLPSSPPPYLGSRQGTIDDDDDNNNISEHGRYDPTARLSTALPRTVSFRQTRDNGAGICSGDAAPTDDKAGDESEMHFDEIAESSVMSFRRKQLFDESRKTSGQSDIRNEDFSPIFIARHSSEDGAVSFAPMELPAHQLRKKLEILQSNQMIVDSELENSSGETIALNDGAGNFEHADEYLKGGGLNQQGGRHPIEESVHRRPLSPSISMDYSDMLPESSLQASTPKQFPTVRTERFSSASNKRTSASPPSPSLPRAPHPSPEKRPRAVPIKTSSPLKLFGPYDTFTNQTLLRRISQFEEQQSNNSISYAADETATSPIPAVYTKSQQYDEVTGSPIPIMRRHPQISADSHDHFDVVNKFGGGELDAYEFDGDVSLVSSIPAHSEEKENVTPSQSQNPTAAFFRFDIHEDTSSEGESVIVRRRQHRVSHSIASGRRIRMSKSLDGLHTRTTTGSNGGVSLIPSTARRNGSEGKRPRTSPSKNPTPKRRRTLHRSDIAYGLEDRRTTVGTVRSLHYTMQSIAARDRKHARQLEIQKPIDPNNPITRHVVRPRSSTPKQRPSEAHDRPPLAELGVDPAPVQASMAPDNTEILGVNDSRKTSMKTQDFFDAAEEVMAMIRNKARPVTGLASVEESEAESLDRPAHDHSVTEDSFQESTQEPFSRPPSRDGHPVSRLPAHQENPELINRLKKYEEHGDLADMMSQSIGSVIESVGDAQNIDQPSRGTGITDRQGHLPGRTTRAYDRGGVVSDIPYVRISRSTEYDGTGHGTTGIPFRPSQSFSNSTLQSVPTASSRGSDSRRLIAPDVVAQLIGNQVGNMVFDDVNKMWQKVKAPRRTVSILPSEDSEDDPFASIPDLTVDSIKEKRHLDLANQRRRPNSDELPKDSSINWSWSEGGTATEESISSKHFTKDHNQAHVETAVEDDEEIEHEISLHEDRIHKATPSHRKNLTITFSSPIASFIQDAPHRDSDDSISEAEPSSEQSLGNITTDSIKRGRHGVTTRPVSGMAASSSRGRTRGISGNIPSERHAFVPRPVSRIDEQDENMSGDQHDEHNEQTQVSIQVESKVMSSEPESVGNPDLSVVMATPDPARAAALLSTPMIGQYVGRFSLSPMSEFTVHQVDNSCALEVSYVVGDRYFVTGDGSKKTMPKSVRSLVEKITEVEPFEPDWETVPELDLSKKRLDTLHMLDEFCTSLVTLEASNNTVSHLDGVPQSVRNLRMTHNVLSEITAWGHLINLQYVDVSNNQIKSLSAFKDLVHLRTIRADNNQIASLDGIKFHDSLQVLRARGNLITHIDFDGTKMQRLTELDLENNQIAALENTEQLTSLSTLNLQQNCLTSFAPSKDQLWPSLRFLKLSSNNLETLDLTALPSLRLLHVDRNNIMTITGFSHCRRLDSLSLREQKGDNVLDTSFLDSACEVRKLFLSGNKLSGFNPGVDFLNLQYLELANCGLRSLAPNTGQLMPNLRMLNINFNAINDLWPLRYIPRLKKLLAAGNQLSEARKVSVALAEFPHLSRLDLRNNGATLGFYAPVQTLVSAEDNGKEDEPDPFTLPDIDVEHQRKFASRLDMGTKMRKRVYDMVVLNDCRQLKMLDGLPVSKDVLSAKDDVWKALVRSGIIEERDNNREDTSTQ